jgi:putative transposase
MTAWAHAPVHKLDAQGTYMITAGTYQKLRHLHSNERLELFQERFFALSKQFGWQLQAWAILANHYHFVAISPQDPKSLRAFLTQLHEDTAAMLNRLDGTPGRQVWYQFWDKQLTYQRSYYARLKYVHNNPAHHGVVADSAQYRWCSKPWFEQTAGSAFKRTIESFKIDSLQVYDDF